MGPSFETDFSAKEPSLGYYYQIRYSLYLLLHERKKENPCIRLEDLDDIVIDDINTKDLFQTKLHINSKANLSDRSSDFWKTIRVWSEAITAGLINDIENTFFTLITTATISNESFIHKLSIKSNELRIGVLESMLLIAGETTNTTNQNGYNAFRSLTNEQREKLVQNIIVIDASLSIEDTLSEIKQELKFSAPVGKLDSFVEKIEGWWFGQCISLLTNKKDYITIKELQLEISNVPYLFSEENLPDDFPNPLTIDEEEISSYEEKIFIKQLKLISIRNNSLRRAISDFRRAYEQRSKWLRDNLTGIEEYNRFDSLLCDHWDRIFSLMKDDCEGLSDDELIKAGKSFYENYYVKSTPTFKIRNNFQPQYMTTGSCHMLADEKKIGWHPNYQKLLKE